MKIFRIEYFPIAILSIFFGISPAAEAAKPPKADTASAAPADSVKTTVAADSAQPALAADSAQPATVLQEQASADAKTDTLEKVIVVGYGAQKKKDVTGAVSVVSGRDLRKANSSNVAASLQGKAAGVNVTSNGGQPGKGMQVRIRGVGSINNSDPLYVVDGMPTASIEYLNPLDIESITVLKDASSTSIYGARAANGVVLITTRKGIPGITKIEYNGTYGVSSPWKKPDLTNATEWATLRNEARKNAGLFADSLGNPTEPELADPSKLGAGTDWWSHVMREDAVNYGHNFSLSQGDKRLNYFLSGGYNKDEGIVRGSDATKATIRSNVTSRAKDWLTIGSNVGFTNQNIRWYPESDEWNSLLITTTAMDPVTPVRNLDGTLATSKYGNQELNPVGQIERNDNTTESNRIKGNVFASVKPIRILELKSNYGIDLEERDSSVFLPKYFVGPADQASSSTVRKQNTQNFSWVWENTVGLDMAFREKHFVKLLGGITAEEDNSEYVLAINSVTPSNDPTQRFLSATSGANPHVEGNAISSTLLSYLARANYDYDYKYFLTASVRRDGSSRFGPNNRWGVFPALGAGWDVTKESFMKPATFLDYLKLRAGWGIIGNQNIDDYLYTSSTKTRQNYPFGKEVNSGVTFTTAGNPDIQWEEQKSTNLGLDFTVFHDWEFTSDFYIKNTSKMLVRPAIPGQVGLQTAPLVNGGEVENKGVELTLAWNKTFGNFAAKVTGSYAMNQNKVVKLGSDGSPIPAVPFRDIGFVNKTEEGHPIGEFYGLHTDGLFQNQAEIDAFTYKDDTGGVHLVQPNAKPGDIKYVDNDHDGVRDVGFIGSPHPDFTYGLSVDLSHKGAYGGVDFYLFLQGVQGNKIFNGTRFYSDNTTVVFNVDRKLMGRWTGEGSTNDPNLPRLDASQNNSDLSDRYIEDGSYLRCKTMTLGYTFPARLTTDLNLPEIRIYAGASNLFTFTDYSGFDPEVGAGRFSGSQATNDQNVGTLDVGIDRGNYPQARTIFTGINVSL